MFCACVNAQSWPTLWTVACYVPLSVEFSRQGYWSGVPFPTPGDVPNLGIEPLDSLLPVPLSSQVHRDRK